MVQRIEYAAVALVLPDDRWVLQRRRDTSGVGAGELGFWGGKVEAVDNSPEDACAREIGEETDLLFEATDLIPVGTFDLDPPIAHRDSLRMYVFRHSIPNMGFTAIDGAAEAYTLPELRQRKDLLPTVRFVLDNILER